MKDCKHEMRPLDGQNVQCENCEFIRHRVGADDLSAHPVRKIVDSEIFDISDLLKNITPAITPTVIHKVEEHPYRMPYENQWQPGHTYISNGTSDDTIDWKLNLSSGSSIQGSGSFSLSSSII